MYSVTVKIEGVESKRRSAGLLHIVVGFFLIAKGADYYRFLNYDSFLPALPFFAVAAISLFYGFFRRRVDIFAKYNFWLRLLQVISFTVLGFAIMNLGRTIDYIGVFIFAFYACCCCFQKEGYLRKPRYFLMKRVLPFRGAIKTSW